MKKRNHKFLLFCLLFWVSFLLFKGEVKAEEKQEDYFMKQMEEYDIGQIEGEIEKLFPDWQIDIERTFLLIGQGKIVEAVKGVLGEIVGSIKGEFAGLKELMVSILVIGIFSAIFSNFADVFAGQQISQVGFYFLYLFLMAILTKAFTSACQIATGTMENIVLFVKIFIPTYFTAVGTAIGSGTAVFYYQVMLVIAYLVESFLLNGLLPIIYSYVILALLNGIWAEERLMLLLDFIKKGIIFALKMTMGIITGFSLVQAVILPAIDGLKLSVLQKTMSAIPGLGNMAEGVAELVIGSAVLIKNSLGVLLLILLLVFCLLPLIKIFAVAGIVKLGAALTGIVSDKRISGCADTVGEGCFLLLRCVFTTVLLFGIVIAVTSYAIGG